MSNNNVPGSNQNVNVQVRTLINDPNVTSRYKTKILHKNVVNGVNTLTQAMMNDTNTKYVIKYDYVLSEDITVPANCVLEFDGGSISASGSNDTITGNNTGINAGFVKIFNTDVTISGSWNVAEAYPEWFGVSKDGITDDTQSTQKAINLASLSTGLTCSLHTGKYLLNGLTIPNSVKFSGIYTRTQESFDKGTVVFVTDIESTISIGMGCIIENLAFYYPNQRGYENGVNTSIAYNPAITLIGNPQEHTQAAGHYTQIRHITFVNPYKGIYIPHAINVIIEDIVGCPLYEGINIVHSGDNIRIKDVHFNANFVDNGALYSLLPYNLERYTYLYGTGISIGRSDGLQISGLLIYGYNYGIKMTGSAGDMIKVIDSFFDACRSGIDTTHSRLIIDSCIFTSFDRWETNTPPRECINIAGQVKDVFINNCLFYATQKCWIDSNATDVRLQITNCRFTESSRKTDKTIGLFVLADSVVHISNCFFDCSELTGSAVGVRQIFNGGILFLNDNIWFNYENPSYGFVVNDSGGYCISKNNRVLKGDFTIDLDQQVLLDRQTEGGVCQDSADRPKKSLYVGKMSFQEDTRKPIWYYGKDTNNNDVWVDATGTVV